MRARVLLIAVLVVSELSLSGCGKGSSGNPLVVRIVSDHTGFAMPGIRLQVTGQGWATTNDAGEAVFAPEHGPFGVLVHQSLYDSGSTVESGEAVFAVDGQTGSAVVLEVDGGPGPLGGLPRKGWHTARVSGSVTGGSASGSTWVQVSCSGMWLPTVVSSDGTFDLGVLFEDGATAVTVRAYEGVPGPSNHVTELDGIASAQVPVVAGGQQTGVSLALQPVDQSTVDGTASVSPSLAGADVYARWSLGFGRYEADSVSRISTLVTPDGFTLPVPAAAGAQTWVAVSAAGATPPSSGTHALRVTPPASNVAFRIPAPVDLVEPASDATVDTTTAFSWTGGEPGGTFELEVSCSWPAGATMRTVSYHVTTTATQATLPDLPDFALAPGGACTWSVRWRDDTNRDVEQRWSRSTRRGATTG